MNSRTKSIDSSSLQTSTNAARPDNPSNSRRKSTIDNCSYEGRRPHVPRKLIRSNIMEEKAKSMENNRLLRRLSEINNRKNRFGSPRSYHDQPSTSNTRARQACRQLKKKEIQHENDKFVERLVNRLNSYHSILEVEQSSVKRRRKPNKKEPFSLPSIYAK